MKMYTRLIIIALSAISWTSAQGPEKGKCVLPPYPVLGTYVTDHANAKPGDSFDSVALNVTCSPGYGLDGPRSYAFCSNGWWPEPVPQCVSQCRLIPDPSVEYICPVSGSVKGSRTCNEYEPTGTVVKSNCRSPNYYSQTQLPTMRCINGTWDNVATCKPECGTVTPQGESLVVGGATAKHGEVPWLAGIYSKTRMPYQQICGGSLVSTTVVITAAHCFWSSRDGKLPTSDYAVAVGKLYRPWNDSKDSDAQRSDVKDIRIPQSFHGESTNYQSDIAIVIVETPFVFKRFIRPLCVDFDTSFEQQQLQPGNKGKVAGWGLTGERGKPSPVVKIVDLPYIDTETCFANSPVTFQPYITADKLCAGYTDGHAGLCRGDAGGGLAFPESDRGIQRYYLRGIASVGATSENPCNLHSYTAFTRLQKHELFVKQFWTS